MSYKNTTLEILKNDFGIVVKYAVLQLPTSKFVPSAQLEKEINEAYSIPHLSEKARSELFVSPLFRELYRHSKGNFHLYSGYHLNADHKRKLNGECDFLLTVGEYDILQVQPTVFTAVEAKRNEIEEGIPQVAAQMLGAYLFNIQKKKPIHTIYGATTNAFDWIFLKLENGSTLTIDSKRYYLNNLPELLGILQGIVLEYQP